MVLNEHFTFQSTLPVGGATTNRGAGVIMITISIHAPRGGSDDSTGDSTHDNTDFNPRSPWGERLTVIVQEIPVLIISIHAPRGGSDVALFAGLVAMEQFQSTLPVGGATRGNLSGWCSR